MFDLKEFLEGLDLLYASGQAKEAEAYLKQGLKGAAAAQDESGILAVLNELMGYYRAASRYEECLLCTKQAVALADAMGLQGTKEYGTTLLNAATGMRAAGRYEEAEELYGEAYRIFSDCFPEPDYRMASLHNNLSLLYSETGRTEKAKRELELAMEIITRLKDSAVETAITHTNLGNLCFQMGRIAEGAEHMRKAAEIFEQTPDSKDSHYASALSGLGEAYYHEGELEKSAEAYEKALREIERCYGRNDYYHVTKQNLETVRALLKKRENAGKQHIKGMELSRAYYEAYGKPMLHEKYPEYENRIAAGLLGEGSECLGFDDAFSADHDFTAGFCLWLTKKDYRKIGKQLQKDYDALPQEFMGFPAGKAEGRKRGRTGVFEIGAFYKGLTGYRKAPETEEKWETIPQERLRAAVSGEIFEDRLGKLSRRREAFRKYPENIRLKKLSASLARMAQAGQYNFGRAKKRQDTGAAYFSMAEFLSAACETLYLLEGAYMPFYKWRMRGLEEISCAREIKPLLEELSGGRISDNEAEERIERICALTVRELKAKGLTASDERFLEVQSGEVLKRMGDETKQEKNR